jgi:hypothetical protein
MIRYLISDLEEKNPPVWKQGDLNQKRISKLRIEQLR